MYLTFNNKNYALQIKIIYSTKHLSKTNLFFITKS